MYCEMGAVPVTGTYTVTVDPSYGEYGSLRLTLKHGPALATTDPPTAFAPVAVAETARFRFSATAGQNLAIGVSGLAYVGTSSAYSNLYVYRPDRSQVGSTVGCLPTLGGGTCTVTLANLPVSGEYSVALVPPAGVKITGNVNLSAELTGTLTPGTAADARRHAPRAERALHVRGNRRREHLDQALRHKLNSLGTGDLGNRLQARRQLPDPGLRVEQRRRDSEPGFPSRDRKLHRPDMADLWPYLAGPAHPGSGHVPSPSMERWSLPPRASPGSRCATDSMAPLASASISA